MNITLVTGNPKKAEQVGYYLKMNIPHRAFDLKEIQSLDLREVVEEKAREAFAQIQSPVLVEDVSLRFHALGRLPGPLIKWFLKELGNERLCRLLDAYEDRSVTAEVQYALYNGNEMRVFVGTATGTVPQHPQGTTDFGWDPIFVPAGSEKSWAEMTMEEKENTSMRKQALEKLKQYLYE